MKKFDSEIKSFIDGFNFKPHFTLKDYQAARADIRKLYKNLRAVNGLYNRKYHQWEIAHLNFVHEKNSKLVLTLQDYFSMGKRSLKHYEKDCFRQRALIDFSNILVVITNNYGLMKDLIFSGREYQAKVIFRDTIELTELCFCILYQEDFFKFFREKHTDSKGNAKYKGIKYELLKKTSAKVIEYVKSVSHPLPPQFWDEYMEIRQYYHEDASSHAHSNFLSIMFGAHVPLIDRDIMLCNLGGVVNKTTKRIAKQIAFYDAISYMILMILMIDRHKLFFNKFGNSIQYLTIMSQASWSLAKHAI